MVGKVESVAAEKDETSKVVADLQARLRENKSKLEEFELKASKERKTNKELEEELLVYKRKGMKQHEKGFYKAIRKAGFFAYNIDLGLFDPSRT